MSIPLTRATLIAAYELLRTTPPFLGWRLPDAGEIEFGVVKGYTQGHQHSWFGDCDGDRINAAFNRHGQISTLIYTVAHEMIHLHQMRNKLETPNTEHNADFRKRAARVCRIHGFDPKVF